MNEYHPQFNLHNPPDMAAYRAGYADGWEAAIAVVIDSAYDNLDRGRFPRDETIQVIAEEASAHRMEEAAKRRAASREDGNPVFHEHDEHDAFCYGPGGCEGAEALSEAFQAGIVTAEQTARIYSRPDHDELHRILTRQTEGLTASAKAWIERQYPELYGQHDGNTDATPI